MATSRRAEIVRRNYHLRLRAIRAEMMRRLAVSYGRVNEDDIRASYSAFVPVAARTITASQAASQTTTRAYVRGVSGLDPHPLPSLAGTSEAGTITDALKGIDLFVLGWIAKGLLVPDALTAGAGLIDRLADNEVTRVVDAEIKGQSDRATGWIGTTFGATDECVDNDGEHSFDEEMVRHPNCVCERDLIFAPSG